LDQDLSQGYNKIVGQCCNYLKALLEENQLCNSSSVAVDWTHHGSFPCQPFRAAHNIASGFPESEKAGEGVQDGI
jgi:hypothetical protein